LDTLVKLDQPRVRSRRDLAKAIRALTMDAARAVRDEVIRLLHGPTGGAS